MSGTLYGVGLGPGDPELVTLKAWRLISGAEVVAYPALPGTPSLARAIAADFIPEDAEEIVVEVPMRTTRQPAQAAYDTGAARIARALEAGRDVVMLCEGDPFFYGSFMYLHARLAADHPVVVVPGVTSLTACAAAAALPLAARNEVFTVLPATLEDTELSARIAAAQSVAIMKVGRHLDRVRAVLHGLGRSERAVYVERATTAEERVLPLGQAPADAPYFSMILAPGDDPWL